MNAKRNISKLPPVGNQQDITDQDYAIGDVVVYASHILTDRLHVVDAFHESGCVGITGFYKREDWLCGWVNVGDIRPATTAELKARRRLSETEQSLAEVS